MASNAASSVQFRVNGTEMARGRTRKTERSQSMDPRAKPRAAGRLKGKRRDNRDEREFILGPENAGNFCIARRSRGISAIVSRRLPRSRLLAQRMAGKGGLRDRQRRAWFPRGTASSIRSGWLTTWSAKAGSVAQNREGLTWVARVERAAFLCPNQDAA